MAGQQRAGVREDDRICSRQGTATGPSHCQRSTLTFTRLPMSTTRRSSGPKAALIPHIGTPIRHNHTARINSRNWEGLTVEQLASAGIHPGMGNSTTKVQLPPPVAVAKPPSLITPDTGSGCNFNTFRIRTAQRQRLEPVAVADVDSVEVHDIEPRFSGEAEQLLVGAPREETRRHVLVIVDRALGALVPAVHTDEEQP